MKTKLQKLLDSAESRKLVVDDGMVDVSDQANMLIDNCGTDREWIAIGVEDSEGFAEVVALAHPINAPLIAHSFNMLPKLVADIEAVLSTNITCLSGLDDEWWSPLLSKLKCTLEEAKNPQ